MSTPSDPVLEELAALAALDVADDRAREERHRRRDALIRRAVKKHSLRTIGACAGMSHTQVSTIAGGRARSSESTA